MKKAIVLLSGGQDSTTCLYWALEKFKKVECLLFDYGQSHIKELFYATENANRVGAPYTVLTVQGLLALSSLTDRSDHNKPSRINPELPDSFTAGRNLLFLALAGSRAASTGISDIVTGVCQTDYSGYPDCRRTTIEAMQLALSLGLGAGDIRIHTPLMYKNKAETWKMAKEMNILDIIIKNTLTDYTGDETQNEWGLGTLDNPASKLRAKGYYEALENGWL